MRRLTQREKDQLWGPGRSGNEIAKDEGLRSDTVLRLTTETATGAGEVSVERR